MTVRALIVDDEVVARRRITRLLRERDDVGVAGEASGGRAAVEAIGQLQPHLIFLDVQMPDLDGFEVLAQLDQEKLPAVVFVTAYDQYALRAFEACAVDYLLKPYEADRFTQAVDRALRWISSGTGSTEEERLKTLLREVLRSEYAGTAGPDAGSAGLDRFMVKRRGRAHFVRADDVDWIEADGNYVRLHVGPANHLIRRTIQSCAERLDPRRFVRIHRRHIVNMDRIKEVQPWFGGDYVVLLTSGQKLRLSRHFREHFQSRMIGD